MLELIFSLAVFMTSDTIAGEALLQGFRLSQHLPHQKLKSICLVV